MSTFNFGSLATTQVSAASSKHLKPYTITKVKWDGAELVTGTKENSTWKAIDLKFTSEEGDHKERVFIPDHTNPADTEDKEIAMSNGGKKLYPSTARSFMQLVAHIAGTLNPKGFEKLQELSSKFRSFDDMTTAFIKTVNNVKGVETNLKLVGRNNNGTIYACFPKVLATNSKNEFFPVNVIGDNLFFSNYEEGKRNEYLNAKPTSMGSVVDTTTDFGVDSPSAGSEDIDFDSLL
jgi:hypothetical protein